MPENNAATPLPPDAGGSNPTPTPALSLVPPEGAQPAPRESGLTKTQLAGITLIVDLIMEGRKPAHLPMLQKEGVDAAFLDALAVSAEQLIVRGQSATNADSDRTGATLASDPAVRQLLQSLRRLQSRARVAYLPQHPEKLANYHVGERITQSRDVLQTRSQQIINQANTDRPGGTNTDFINAVQVERNAVVGVKQAQQDHLHDASQARALRDAEYADLVARRRKIQYAADIAWPFGNPQNVAVRAAFRLPKNRPFSN